MSRKPDMVMVVVSLFVISVLASGVAQAVM